MSYEAAQEDAEGNKLEARIKVDKKDEMRVIAYIQAVSQVVLNIATTDTANNQAGIDQDTIMKFIAATISALSEYILNSTWKIRSAATSAVRLILSHGLAKVSGT